MGQNPACSIHLDDPDLLSEHAVIRKAGNGFEIQTPNESNRISVNGLPLCHHSLQPGDILQIGRSAFYFLKSDLPIPDEVYRTCLTTSPPSILVGQSPRMCKLFDHIALATRSDLPVLIQGENGTGKELIARTLHAYSARKNSPFLPVSCGTLSSSLLESELFGHEQGAFTGAHQQRPGYFELADTGSLFLDEITGLDVSLQNRLLRVLAEKEFTRVGGRQPIPNLARILTATTLDLREEIDAGRFREDLFFRLHVIPIHVPPLREHTEDLPILIQNHLNVNHPQIHSWKSLFTQEAFNRLFAYSWPGNVRELFNLVDRVLLLGHTEKNPFQGHPDVSWHQDTASDPASLELTAVERNHILRVLQIAEGNKSLAARLMGIERSSLYSKLKRHTLD
jgi:DNA-binding NtrC family response regulator